MLARQYMPFAITLRVDPDRQSALAAVLPFLADMRPVNGRAAAYVCRNFTCRQPAIDPEALEQELRATA